MGGSGKMPAMGGTMVTEFGDRTAQKWYRGVTPTVSAPERDSLAVWKNAYESRFMRTSLQNMHAHIGECIEQVHQTHREKQAYFQEHSLPHCTWMDLTPLTHDRSLTQKQPAYYADVGGIQRMGVHDRRMKSTLDARVLFPNLNINS